jgi:exosome complex RNA-binding protein Csl4
MKLTAVITIEHVMDAEDIEMYEGLTPDKQAEYVQMMEEGLTEHLREDFEKGDVIIAKVVVE